MSPNVWFLEQLVIFNFKVEIMEISELSLYNHCLNIGGSIFRAALSQSTLIVLSSLNSQYFYVLKTFFYKISRRKIYHLHFWQFQG